MTTHSRIIRRMAQAGAIVAACAGAQAAELTLEGLRLRVSGTLEDAQAQQVAEQLRENKVRTVVFENSAGGSAKTAEVWARMIRASGVATEFAGQCQGACAYAFLAGQERRFGRGLQVDALLVPVKARPAPSELAVERPRPSGEAVKTALQYNAGTDSAAAFGASDALLLAVTPPAVAWRPEQGVLFTATPTLYGRVYNAFYCDGTQGSDFSRCEPLDGADPFKLGVLTP